MSTAAMKILLLLCTPSLFIMMSQGFETIEDYICTQRFKGARVDYSERACVEGEIVGCWNPFPYKDMKECLQDFYGRSNICERYKPCRHNGICSQVTNKWTGRTFKCECANTGYYGHQCEKRCPMVLPQHDQRFIPCLEI